MISSLSHQVQGDIRQCSQGWASPGHQCRHLQNRPRLQKVMRSQLAKVPLVSKLVPARSGLCFSQVRRCDPGAPSSFCSLSWRCKGLGGGAGSPSKMLQQDFFFQKGQVCTCRGSAGVWSVQASDGGRERSGVWCVRSGIECAESSRPPEPKVEKEAAS